MPAEDESVDDMIEVERDGRDAGVALQIARDGYSLNVYEGEGEEFSARTERLFSRSQTRDAAFAVVTYFLTH